MVLTPGVTISPGDQVTRQTIYNLIANATPGSVALADLAPSARSLIRSPTEPTNYPGQLWYDETEDLLKVWTDVLDGTTVSVWLAIGPDRFDTPMLASEPLPFGAAVQLDRTRSGRWAKAPPDGLSLATYAGGWQKALWETWRVIGFNQNGHGLVSAHATIESGTWFACGIEGYVWTWRPVSFQSFASKGNNSYDGLISGISGLTGPSGISLVRGGLVWTGMANPSSGAGIGLVPDSFANSPHITNIFWQRNLFFGARKSRI